MKSEYFGFEKNKKNEKQPEFVSYEEYKYQGGEMSETEYYLLDKSQVGCIKGIQFRDCHL